MKGDEGGSVDLERHLRQLLLGELVSGDRLAEDDSLTRVVERAFEARPRRADRAEHDPEPRLVEARERAAQRRRTRQDVRVGYSHVLEDELRGHGRAQGELLVDLRSREPAHALLDDEAADLACFSACPDDRDVGDRPVRDPHLRSVQDPVGPVTARVCAHRARVGAGVGFGEAEAAHDLARVHRRQPALLLLLGAPAPDREHRERTLDGDGASYAGVASFELHAGEPIGDRARAREPVSVEVHSEQTELAELPDQLAREPSGLEPVADVWQHPRPDELANGVANRALLVVEQRVDREVVERIERRPFRRRRHASTSYGTRCRGLTGRRGGA